eukprot:scaffold64_cov338-Pavlova_lutheri.AAC.49
MRVGGGHKRADMLDANHRFPGSVRKGPANGLTEDGTTDACHGSNHTRWASNWATSTTKGAASRMIAGVRGHP